MNLCIDVGNTTIGMGFFKEEKLIKKIVLTIDLKKTKDEYISVLKRTLDENSFDVKGIKNIILSSVVPSINGQLKMALVDLFDIEPMLIAPGIKTGLIIHVDNPSEIGNDLIAVMVGVKDKYSYPCLIADLGTASKILLIDKNGAFTTCTIMPGLSISAATLTSKTALLPEISFTEPKTVLARNTIDAINAGVVYGHADMVDGLIRRFEKEIGYKCKHILTGGGSMYIKNVLQEEYIYDPDICLYGLNRIIVRNEGK